MGWNDRVEFSELVGKTLLAIEVNDSGSDDCIIFRVDGSDDYKMYHDQDCCEDVHIEDICGDVRDLVGSPILTANEVSNESETDYGSQTWTFYTIATVMGSITIRWNGESNGYYSESVDFEKLVSE